MASVFEMLSMREISNAKHFFPFVHKRTPYRSAFQFKERGFIKVAHYKKSENNMQHIPYNFDSQNVASKETMDLIYLQITRTAKLLLVIICKT